MRKIKSLINKGWMVDIRANLSDGNMWYNVGASHNTWGNVDVWNENLTTAIEEMYKQAKDLESVWE